MTTLPIITSFRRRQQTTNGLEKHLNGILEEPNGNLGELEEPGFELNDSKMGRNGCFSFDFLDQTLDAIDEIERNGEGVLKECMWQGGGGFLGAQGVTRLRNLGDQGCIMPKSIHVDHYDIAHYIPMYHQTGGFTGHEREVYKSLVFRHFHEGRVIKPYFLENEPNLRNTFAAIGFDCLLDLDEQIFPIFVLQFYKSVRIIRNLNRTISIAFIIDNVETTLTLDNFAQILKILSEGVCLYTSKWPISSIIIYSDPYPNIYPPPHEEPTLIRDALFHTRIEPKYRSIKGDKTILDPYQMINTKLKEVFKKWELILSENVISLTRPKDHPNASLCYMLYCLSIGKSFNLAYYIAHRMVSVTQSSDMTLLYAMLLTRLYKHVQANHPYALSNDF
ncbi:hypothetical protein Tco_0906389 [Tanacetum coccineum]|uniref:Uncharacterized protein n=1 Tax=Tanacetum coccineum TaxID=301880 RepID=A0ABQ5CMH2_9ASTR